jgi:hypothetical protein
MGVGFFVVIFSKVLVSSRTVSPKVTVMSGDDAADGGVAVGMGGGAKLGGMVTCSTISAVSIGAFPEPISDSKPLMEPGSFFLIASCCIVYS